MADFVIGTRGSALALWQAHAVQDALAKAHPELDFKIKVIKTVGDANLSTPLDKIDDKGLFTKELESALLAGEIDACVHSMKDVPGELAPGCTIGAMLPRADVRDVLVCGPRISGASSLSEVPAGARIATGSLRRAAQLQVRHPQVVAAPIRGNVDTRVRKALGPDYEGAVLAAAGVTRLGLSEHISAYIDPADMIPAVGQGAIGVETREEARVQEIVRSIDDPATSSCVTAERIILRELNGGCKVPMGAYARFDGSDLVFDAFVSSLDGGRMARVHLVRGAGADGEPADPSAVAWEALESLYDQDARDIRDEITLEQEQQARKEAGQDRAGGADQHTVKNPQAGEAIA